MADDAPSEVDDEAADHNKMAARVGPIYDVEVSTAEASSRRVCPGEPSSECIRSESLRCAPECSAGTPSAHSTPSATCRDGNDERCISRPNPKAKRLSVEAVADSALETTTLTLEAIDRNRRLYRARGL